MNNFQKPIVKTTSNTTKTTAVLKCFDEDLLYVKITVHKRWQFCPAMDVYGLLTNKQDARETQILF